MDKVDKVDKVEELENLEEKEDLEDLVLTEEEKLALLHLIKTSDSDQVIKDSKETLIEAHSKLISSIVKRHGFMDDYNVSFQTGVYGVLKAIDRFDITKIKNCKVASFFGIWIFKEMKVEKTLKGLPVSVSHSTAEARHNEGKPIGRMSIDGAVLENIGKFTLEPDEFFDFGIDDDKKALYNILHGVLKEFDEEELSCVKDFLDTKGKNHRRSTNKEEALERKNLTNRRHIVMAKLKKIVLKRSGRSPHISSKTKIESKKALEEKTRKRQKYYQDNKESLKSYMKENYRKRRLKKGKVVNSRIDSDGNVKPTIRNNKEYRKQYYKDYYEKNKACID